MAGAPGRQRGFRRGAVYRAFLCARHLWRDARRSTSCGAPTTAKCAYRDTALRLVRARHSGGGAVRCHAIDRRLDRGARARSGHFEFKPLWLFRHHERLQFDGVGGERAGADGLAVFHGQARRTEARAGRDLARERLCTALSCDPLDASRHLVCRSARHPRGGPDSSGLLHRGRCPAGDGQWPRSRSSAASRSPISPSYCRSGCPTARICCHHRVRSTRSTRLAGAGRQQRCRRGSAVQRSHAYPISHAPTLAVH